MSDSISIAGLTVETRIGVTQEERSRPQAVVIDIDISKDLARAASSDDLAHTIDYDSLVDEVAALVRSSDCALLEHLAGQICDLVSGKSGVSGVTVKVGKEHVPVKEKVLTVSVSLERGSSR